MALYFDTSAINWVHDHGPDLPSVLRSRGKVTQISVYNILEMAATQNPERRESLLGLCLELSQECRPLVEVKDILAVTLRAYLDGENRIEVSVPPDHPSWMMMDSPSLVGEKQRLEAHSQMREIESGFRGFHRNGRPHLQALPVAGEFQFSSENQRFRPA